MGAEFNKHRQEMLRMLEQATGKKGLLWYEWVRDGHRPGNIVLHNRWDEPPCDEPRFVECQPRRARFKACDGSIVDVVSIPEVHSFIAGLKKGKQKPGQNGGTHPYSKKNKKKKKETILDRDESRKIAARRRDNTRRNLEEEQSAPRPRPEKSRRVSTASLYLNQPNLGLLDDDHVVPGE